MLFEVKKIPREEGDGYTANVLEHSAYIVGDGETPVGAIVDMFDHCRKDIRKLLDSEEEEVTR